MCKNMPMLLKVERMRLCPSLYGGHKCLSSARGKMTDICCRLLGGRTHDIRSQVTVWQRPRKFSLSLHDLRISDSLSTILSHRSLHLTSSKKKHSFMSCVWKVFQLIDWLMLICFFFFSPLFYYYSVRNNIKSHYHQNLIIIVVT